MNNKKGISLIVLVITILVMIILAGVVVVSLQKNNPIEKSKEAKIKDSVASIRGAISQYAVTQQAATTETDTDVMGALLSDPAITTTGEYKGYKKLNYDAADIKAELGVDPSILKEDGDFYVDPTTGTSVFQLKKENAKLVGDGIVAPNTVPAT